MGFPSPAPQRRALGRCPACLGRLCPLDYNPAVRRNRSCDPKKFDLTTPCPACGYKIPPAELMMLDFKRMRCPNCKQDVEAPTVKSGSTGTAVPTKQKE